MTSRRYRAGESLEDFCRACKTDRMHTVVAADPDGVPIRVVCGFCQSEHNYRGGPRIGAEPDAPAAGSTSPPSRRPSVRPDRQPFPIVSERERIAPPISESSNMDIEMILRRVIREEAGITPVTPAEKWRGGTQGRLPGPPGGAGERWPFATFFQKIWVPRNLA